MKKITLVFTSLALACSLHAQVLYDNGSIITHPGQGFGGADASALMNGLASYGYSNANTYFRFIADDFTVNSTWTVDSLIFYGYQTGSTTTSTFNFLSYAIWNGDPSGTGQIIFGDTSINALVKTYFSRIYRTTDTNLTNTNRPVMKVAAKPTGLVLAPGTYWISWRCGGSLTSGPWVPPITSTTQTNTGNGMQFTNGAWMAIVDGNTGDPQGFPFIIKGTSTGIREINGIANVQVYPNPVVDHAQIAITLSTSEITLKDISFVVYDVLGNEVKRMNDIPATTFAFYRESLSAGLYTYKFITRRNEILKTGKLIIE